MRHFFLLLLLVGAPSLAQVTFEPGYFVTNPGVKTECLIRNVAWRNNPVQFDYRLSETAAIQSGKLAEIAEFNVNNYKFRRFSITIDRSPTDINKLSVQKNPEWNPETVFLKVLVEGEINLYQYEESNFIRFFISSGKHESAEQLVYKEYRAESTYIGENNQFRQQLFTALPSEKLKKSDFENLPYKQKELVAIVMKVNAGSKQPATNLNARQNKANVNFKVTAGISLASVSVDDRFGPANSGFNSEPVFRIGLEAEYILPFNQNKWAVFIDPNYQAIKADQKKGAVVTAIDYSFVELPAGIRHYMFVNPKYRIFIDAGYTLAFASKAKLQFGGNGLTIADSGNEFAGVGFSDGHFGIEIRYNFKRGLLDTGSYTANYQSFSLIAGYRFF